MSDGDSVDGSVDFSDGGSFGLFGPGLLPWPFPVALAFAPCLLSLPLPFAFALAPRLCLLSLPLSFAFALCPLPFLFDSRAAMAEKKGPQALALAPYKSVELRCNNPNP